MDMRKLKSAVEVVKYLTSREMQKNLVLQQMIISGMTSLYDDEEICSSIKYCDVYKGAQPIEKPINKTKNFLEYTDQFSNYFFDFLYGNETAENALKNIDNITKIHYVTISLEKNFVGSLILIFFSITIFLMIASLLILNIEKFKDFFSFLTKPSWYLVITGIIFILSSGFSKLGMVSNFKCHISEALIYIGFSFIYIPILGKLIIYFPENNKISVWINNNKCKFILIFNFISFMLNLIYIIYSYDIEDIIVIKGENYQKCKMNSLFGKIIYLSIIVYNCVIIISLLLLIFIEWNLKETHYNIRFTVSSLYINIISIFIFYIFDNISLKNYIAYFEMYEIFIFITSILNYLLLYGIRIMLPILKVKNKETEIIDKIRVHESSYEKSDNIQSDDFNINNSKNSISKASSYSNSMYSKLINLHYYN